MVWFAGLFYLVRLLVYHVEANQQPEPAQTILKKQYQLMEKRLFDLITTPGMIVAVVMAIAILVVQPALLSDRWLQIKLALVGVLLGYHGYCGYLVRQFAAERYAWSSQQLRILNEVPTLLLVSIVLLAVFKDQLPMNGAALTIGGLIVVGGSILHFYAKMRQHLSDPPRVDLSCDHSFPT
jgi:putative membrane protein